MISSVNTALHVLTASLLPDATAILHAFGPWVLVGIALIIFIESGVLFPFLPGDSLLVTAAVLASTLGIQPWQVLLVGIPAAILGDQTGFCFCAASSPVAVTASPVTVKAVRPMPSPTMPGLHRVT